MYNLYLLYIMTEYQYAFEYLHCLENELDKKINSTENLQEIIIPIQIPTNIELESLLSSIKMLPYDERNNFIAQFKLQHSVEVNDCNDKYCTVSETYRLKQLEKFKLKKEKINRIKSCPEILYKINNKIIKKNKKKLGLCEQFQNN